MSNPWAPKSAYDETDAPLVATARRWHVVLYALLFVLGMGFGWLVFELLGGGFPIRRWLESGVLMLFFGGGFGELGNALWLLMCRKQLRLSAAEAAAALLSPSIPSFVLRPLYERLYGR